MKQMARIGSKNGMFGVRRCGKDNPNYGKGNKIRGENNVMKNPLYKAKHKKSIQQKKNTTM